MKKNQKQILKMLLPDEHDRGEHRRKQLVHTRISLRAEHLSA